MADPAAWIGAAMLVAAAFAWDVRKSIIPNVLTLPALIAGAAYQGVCHGISGLLWSLAGAGAGFGILLAMYLLRGIGAGDVKLFAALGAWVGSGIILYVAMYAVLVAGVVGLAWAAAAKWSVRNKRFPFMIAVLPAFAVLGAIAAGWL